MTGGIGVDRAIDAVGIDADAPHAHTGTNGGKATAGRRAARPGR